METRDWSNLKEDLAKPGATQASVAELYGVSVTTISRQVIARGINPRPLRPRKPKGLTTAIYFPAGLKDRREAIKNVTDYPDTFIYEHGLTGIERELLAAAEREPEECSHPSYYPSGRCRWCLSARGEVLKIFNKLDPGHGVPGALFRSASG